MGLSSLENQMAKFLYQDKAIRNDVGLLDLDSNKAFIKSICDEVTRKKLNCKALDEFTDTVIAKFKHQCDLANSIGK